MQQKQIIFIGLGTMGYHMAGNLANNSQFELSVFNRTISKAEKWQQEFDGIIVKNLTTQIADFDIIILCSGRDEDIDEIFFDKENGIIELIKEQAVVIDHTTTSYDMALKLESHLASKNISFIDAPVSGGEIGAKNGALSIMVGGNKETLVKIKPILETYSKSITHMGDVGAGQLTKMANQICITGVLQGLSEALVFAEANNLNINKLLQAISGGAAGSWQMENRLTTMHNRKFDFGFAIKWMIKDLGYCLNTAKQHNVDLELVQKVYDEYKKLAKNGCENFDTSALVLSNTTNKKQ